MVSLPSVPLTQLHGSNGPVHALTYSSSPSTYILTGSADRSIRLYNPFPGGTSSSRTIQPSKLIQTYSAHGYEVLDISVSPDNAKFASCGGDRSVFLWDVATAKTIRRLGGNQGHSARINSVCFAAGGDVVLSASFDASVRIWDLKSQNFKPIQILADAKDSVSCVTLGKEGTEIVTGSVDGRIRWYDIRMGKMTTDVVGAPVTSVSVTKDGETALVSTLDGTIRLMDRERGTSLMSYKGHQNKEYRIRSCLGARENFVLSGTEGVEGSQSEDGEVYVWETATGTVAKKIAVPSNNDPARKRAVGSDGKPKVRKNVISALAWKDNGKADQWCCAGTDGVVTVFVPAHG